MNLDGVRPYCRIVNKKNESISDIAFAHIIKRVKNSSCTHPKAALVFLGEKGFCDSMMFYLLWDNKYQEYLRTRCYMIMFLKMKKVKMIF